VSTPTDIKEGEFRIWITQNALTKGIRTAMAREHPMYPGIAIVRVVDRFVADQVTYKDEWIQMYWYRTREDAVRSANKIRAGHVASWLRTIERHLAVNYEDVPDEPLEGTEEACLKRKSSE
jgi:hypothetical protein